MVDIPEDTEDGCEVIFDLEDDNSEDFDPADDCMLMDDGQCMAAGSEWCEFECPYRDTEKFVGSSAWIAKQGWPSS